MSLPGVENILSYARPRIALSVVAVDSSMSLAEQIASELRIALDEAVHLPPNSERCDLSRAIPIEQVSIRDLGVRLPELIQRADQAESWRLLERLGSPEKLKRLDTHQLPLVHLILDESHLLDGSKRSNLSDVLRTISKSASCLCVTFVGGAEKSVYAGVGPDEFNRWLVDFEFSPCRTSVWWLNQRLDSGRTLDSSEYTSALASLIAADIVHFDETNDRVLSFETSTGNSTLGTWGLRAICFSPLKITDQWNGRTTRTALDATVLKKTQADANLNVGQLPSAPAILAEVLDEAGNPKVRLLLNTAASVGGENRQSSPGSHPYILGLDHREDKPFQATVAVGGDQFRQKLDDTPRHLWQEAVHEWDFFHRQEAIDVWLAPLQQKFLNTAEKIEQQIKTQIHHLFRKGHRADQLAEACKTLSNELATAWQVAVQPGGARNLRQSQLALQAALAAIPHWPTLVGRVGLLVVVQLMILWTLLNGAAPFRNWLVAGAVLAVLATIGQGLWTWFIAWKRVNDARDQAVEDIERRCELLACQRMGNGLSSLTSQIANFVRRLGAELSEYHRGIESAFNKIQILNQDRDVDSRMLVYLPNAQQSQQEYDRFLAESLTDGQTNVVQNIRNSAAEVFFVTSEPPSNRSDRFVEKTRQLIKAAVRDFFDRRVIVDYVSIDKQPSDSLGNPELSWLLKDIQVDRYFLEGRLAREADLSAATQRQHLVLPGSLSFARVENESILNRRSGLKGTAIRLFRVVLAESSGKPEGNPR